MKKLLILASVLAVSGLLVSPASAVRDHSFTYDSTAGMFEDMYDFFMYSPAYMPSFQKNAFWGQLSNLHNAGDQIFDNDGGDYYLLGGQGDLAGLGRVGLMFDWNSFTNPVFSTNYGGTSGSGYVESTIQSFIDSNADGIIDAVDTTTSHIKRLQNNFNDDLYLAYGLGSGPGLDLGIALRANWDFNSPSYDPYYSSFSFDEVAQVRRSNLLLPQQLTFTFDRTRTGSLDYSETNWNLILAGRLKDLMPNLDTIVNVGPVLTLNGNKVVLDATDLTNNSPSNPGVISDVLDHQTLSGIEANTGVYPGSGIGVFANVRGDYTMNPNLVLTGILGGSLAPMGISSDAKMDNIVQDRTRVPNGSLTQSDDNFTEYLHNYSGRTSETSLFLKLRAQFLAKGWKLGLGANVRMEDSYSEVTDNYHATNRFTRTGTGVPGNDYVYTETWGNETLRKNEQIANIIELPVGLVIQVLDVLPIRFGARHVIQINSSTSSAEMKNLYDDAYSYVYGNGFTTSGVFTQSGVLTSEQVSTYSAEQYTDLVYGASWWPDPQIQIDFTGFYNVLTLGNYQLSFNIYF